MTVFYVSTTGSDLAAGTSLTTAFRTLERARDAMRATAGDDTTLVKGGVYSQTTPLVLDQRDNGASFAAMSGEAVTLSGGQSVTGWTQGAGGIWTAPVDAADMHQFTVNGVRMAEARHPNETPADPIQGGWLFGREPAAGTNPLQQLTYDPANFAPGQLSAGLSVRVFTDASWASSVLTIQSVDTVNHVITFAQPADYELGAASRFYILGKQPLLDAPGEWWFDTAAKVLHFKAPAGFNGIGAVASGMNDIVQIDGANSVRFSGFMFADSASGDAHADRASAAIRINGAQNVVIENNSFQNLIKGIHCEAFTQGAIVRGNDFAHLWASAVDLDHGSRLNQILSNKIRWTGEAFVAPAAINLSEGYGNAIAHNLILDIPRNGIQGVNYDPNLLSGGNIVEFNTIIRSGQQTSDGGGIYFYSSPDRVHDGEIVRHNRIVDTGGLETEAGGFRPDAQFSHGIYMDDFTNKAQITGNFVQTSVRGGIYLHGGSNNAVTNNITLNNKDIGIQLFEIGQPMTGNSITRNIVGMSGPNGNIVELNPAFVASSSFKDNFYLDADPNAAIFSRRSFADWRALGFDAGSDLISGALFRSPTSGDYRLKAGSLPLNEGFTDLLWSQMSAFRGGQIVAGSLGLDSLRGGTGNDVLFGLEGNDRLHGGAGADDLDGGAGSDTASYALAAASVTANLANPRVNLGEAAGDTYWQVENVHGSRFADTLTGDASANRLHGLAGHDKIAGGGGNDVLAGGLGNDLLFGEACDDRIAGAEGRDRLSGGLGRDTLSGGAESDTFVFVAPGEGPDAVLDFAAGLDRIEISRIGFGVTALVLHAGATPVVGGAGGQFLYDTDAGRLSFDADGAGPGAAVWIATFAGRPALGAGDFVLA